MNCLVAGGWMPIPHFQCLFSIIFTLLNKKIKYATIYFDGGPETAGTLSLHIFFSVNYIENAIANQKNNSKIGYMCLYDRIHIQPEMYILSGKTEATEDQKTRHYCSTGIKM